MPWGRGPLNHCPPGPAHLNVAVVLPPQRGVERSAGGAQVSSRLHDGSPAGYEEFWEDGRRVGRREVAQVLIKPETMPAEGIVGHLTTTEVIR